MTSCQNRVVGQCGPGLRAVEGRERLPQADGGPGVPRVAREGDVVRAPQVRVAGIAKHAEASRALRLADNGIRLEVNLPVGSISGEEVVPCKGGRAETARGFAEELRRHLGNPARERLLQALGEVVEVGALIYRPRCLWHGRDPVVYSRAEDELDVRAKTLLQAADEVRVGIAEADESRAEPLAISLREHLLGPVIGIDAHPAIARFRRRQSPLRDVIEGGVALEVEVIREVAREHQVNAAPLGLGGQMRRAGARDEPGVQLEERAEVQPVRGRGHRHRPSYLAGREVLKVCLRSDQAAILHAEELSQCGCAVGESGGARRAQQGASGGCDDQIIALLLEGQIEAEGQVKSGRGGVGRYLAAQGGEGPLQELDGIGILRDSVQFEAHRGVSLGQLNVPHVPEAAPGRWDHEDRVVRAVC